MSLGSSGVVRFTLVRLWGRCVQPGSLGTFGFALGIVGFNRGCWFHPVSLGSLGFSLGVVGFIRGHWVHSGLP